MSAVSHTTMKILANLAYNHGSSNKKDDPNSKVKTKIIVDKENGGVSGIKGSIIEAIAAATPGTIIKIASNVYEEELLITKPGLQLEPKDKNGEVTLQQRENPCIVIDVGEGNFCSINNLRMLLKGPNRDKDVRNFQVDMNFEMEGNEKCMREFFTHKPEEMYCIILVRSGTLRLNGCTLSLDGIQKETYRKVPCVAGLPNSRLEINKCNFKGDTINDSDCTGILGMNSDCFIRNSTLAYFKCGGIMVEALPQNQIYIADNTILSCRTVGLYIQGRASRATVRGNKIAFCHATAIYVSLDVECNIYGNEMTLNEVGVEIYNNKSRIIDNTIQKSHKDGIKVIGNNRSTNSAPLIWRNYIRQSGHNGIIGLGIHCEPDIRGNVIIDNRRAGIKLTEGSVAHIGGTNKVDIKFIPSAVKSSTTSNSTFQTAKVEAVKVYLEQENMLMEEVDNELKKDELLINVKSFPNPNVIQGNFNQGILLVEGSSAKIIANKIDGNIKANIALGGKGSGETRIKFNYIENSKSEGIFVIEGEEYLLIEDNEIAGNNDGVVMVNSLGCIKENRIKGNNRSGILTASKTKCIIDSNTIEDNFAAGILIKNPSLPDLRRNEIAKNFFQVQMEKHAREKWGKYVKDNPKIIGNNEVPEQFCTLF